MRKVKAINKSQGRASSKRKSWPNRLSGFLFGYDFFISYAHNDAGNYATKLAGLLQKEGFECFLDRKSYIKGDNWRIAGRRALKKTQRLVLLASPDALTSEPVLTELKIFKGEGKRVIPIDFGGTLDREKHQSKVFDYISKDDIWITESANCIAPNSVLSEQKPSYHVVIELTNSFNLERQEKKRLKWITRFAFLLVALLIAATYQWLIAQENEKRAVSQLALSDLQRGVDQCKSGKISNGLLFLLRGYNTSIRANNSHLTNSSLLLLGAWSRYLGSHSFHGSEVTEVAYSPDGQYCISGDYDGGITVFDKKSGVRLASLDGHRDSIEALVFSDDGNILITAGEDGHAFVWNIPSFKRRPFVLKHKKRINSVAISLDGRRVATGSDDKTARIWDLFEKVQLATIMHSQRVGVVEFTPDGTILATGSNDNTVGLWNAFDGSSIKPAIQHQGPVNSLSFSSTGELLATDDQRVVRIWDVKSQQNVTTTSPHSHVISDLAFSPDDKYLIAGSYDNTARIWEVLTGKPKGSALVHRGQIGSVGYSANGHFVATADFDNVAQVWFAPSGRATGVPFVHDGGINAMAIDPTGESLLTGSSKGRSRIWYLSHELPYRKLMASPLELKGFTMSSTESADAIAFSPTQNILLAGGINNSSQIWNIETGKSISTPLEHQSDVDMVGFNSVGTHAFTAFSKTVYVWNVAQDPSAGKSLVHPDEVLAVKFLSNDRILTGCKDKVARVWNAVTGELINDNMLHEKPVYIIAISPDEQYYFTGIAGGTGRLWNAETHTIISTEIRHEKSITAAAFSPRGNWLVTASYDGTAIFWNSKTGIQKGSTLIHRGGIRALALSPDGKLVATAGKDNAVRIWNVKNHKMTGPVLRHNDIVSDVDFSPDGRIIATTSHDRSAILWDTFTGLPLTPPLDHGRYLVEAVSFSADGQYLVTGARDLTVRVWDISRVKRFFVLNGSTITSFIESLTGLSWATVGGIRELSESELEARQTKKWAEIMQPSGYDESKPGSFP